MIPFGWRRGRLFDRLAVLALFELVVEEAPNGATVVTWRVVGLSQKWGTTGERTGAQFHWRKRKNGGTRIEVLCDASLPCHIVEGGFPCKVSNVDDRRCGV